MAWDASTQTLTYPFTKIGNGYQGDLEKALGVSVYKNQISLFANGNINKWAKYKAIIRPNADYSSQLDSNHEWKSTADWWRGNDGQCGMSFSTFDSLGVITSSTSFLYKLLNNQLPWTYTRPTGTSTQPLRCFDFIQYYAGAPKPVDGMPSQVQMASNNSVTVQPDLNRGSALTLQLSDFTISNVSVADYYLGVLLYYSSSQYTYMTAADKIGNGDSTCLFTNMSSYSGKDVTAVPFLSSVRITQGASVNAGTFLSVDVAPSTMRIKAYTDPYTLTALAQWSNTLYARVLYDVRLYNNTGTAVSNDTITLRVFRSDQTEKVGETTRTGISVAANGYTDVTNWNLGISVNDTHSATATYTLQITSSSGHWSGTTTVEPPRN